MQFCPSYVTCDMIDPTLNRPCSPERSPSPMPLPSDSYLLGETRGTIDYILPTILQGRDETDHGKRKASLRPNR